MNDDDLITVKQAREFAEEAFMAWHRGIWPNKNKKRQKALYMFLSDWMWAQVRRGPEPAPRSTWGVMEDGDLNKWVKGQTHDLPGINEYAESDHVAKAPGVPRTPEQTIDLMVMLGKNYSNAYDGKEVTQLSHNVYLLTDNGTAHPDHTPFSHDHFSPQPPEKE